jgi:hypothetical protein
MTGAPHQDGEIAVDEVDQVHAALLALYLHGDHLK